MEHVQNKKVPFVHLGGIIGNESKKSNQIMRLNQEFIHLETALAVILRNEKIISYFGDKANQENKLQFAYDNQEKEGKWQRYKTLLNINNFIQYSFFDRETKIMELDHIRKQMAMKDSDFQNQNENSKGFGQACLALKNFSSALLLAENPDQDLENNKIEEENENEDSPIDIFQNIQSETRELRDLLREVPSVQLSKFLEMRVADGTQIYKVIQGFRNIFKYALGLPEEEIKFKNSNLIKLYLGMPLNGIKNSDRVEFIDWVREQEFDTEVLDSDDESNTEEALICNILGRWLNKLADILEILKDTDLDNMKKKTVDKDNQNVKRYTCNYANWFNTSLTDDLDITMVQLTQQADISTRVFQISIVDGINLKKFETVKISHFKNSQTFSFKQIRENLAQYLNIENKHYIISRTLSSKTALYLTEESLFDDVFANDSLVFYAIDTQEYQFIQDKVKDYLFIQLTVQLYIPVVLETSRKVGEQLELIKAKLQVHGIMLSIDDLKSRLSWDNKNINYDLPYSSFVQDNTQSQLGKCVTLFQYASPSNSKPTYHTEIHNNSVNLRLKPMEIMRHYYQINYEEYRKQDFQLKVMGASILGFDISYYSTSFNFVDQFSIDMNDVVRGEDVDEKIYHFIPLAILTRKPDDTGSQLFFWNNKDSIWSSATTRNHYLNKAAIDQQMVKYVYYINTGEEIED